MTTSSEPPAALSQEHEEVLIKFLDAAHDYTHFAGQAYKAANPEKHSSLMAGWKAGKLQLTVRLVMTLDNRIVSLNFVDQAGDEFEWLHADIKRVDPRALN